MRCIIRLMLHNLVNRACAARASTALTCMPRLLYSDNIVDISPLMYLLWVVILFSIDPVHFFRVTKFFDYNVPLFMFNQTTVHYHGHLSL